MTPSISEERHDINRYYAISLRPNSFRFPVTHSIRADIADTYVINRFPLQSSEYKLCFIFSDDSGIRCFLRECRSRAVLYFYVRDLLAQCFCLLCFLDLIPGNSDAVFLRLCLHLCRSLRNYDALCLGCRSRCFRFFSIAKRRNTGSLIRSLPDLFRMEWFVLLTVLLPSIHQFGASRMAA